HLAARDQRQMKDLRRDRHRASVGPRPRVRGWRPIAVVLRVWPVTQLFPRVAAAQCAARRAHRLRELKPPDRVGLVAPSVAPGGSPPAPPDTPHPSNRGRCRLLSLWAGEGSNLRPLGLKVRLDELQLAARD